MEELPGGNLFSVGGSRYLRYGVLVPRSTDVAVAMLDGGSKESDAGDDERLSDRSRGRTSSIGSVSASRPARSGRTHSDSAPRMRMWRGKCIFLRVSFVSLSRIGGRGVMGAAAEAARAASRMARSWARM